jgi:hypothetical protein
MLRHVHNLARSACNALVTADSDLSVDVMGLEPGEKLAALPNYETSPLFAEREQAALAVPGQGFCVAGAQLPSDEAPTAEPGKI